jgi:tetratricopeptide (TPR) repeat protein
MTYLFRLILGLWLSLLPPFLPVSVQAQESAHLYLQNLALQDDRLLVVTVQLEDVVDLYGAEVQLQFDPAQLKVRDEDPRLDGVQIAPGPLLAFDDRFVAANKADNQTGVIDFVFTLLKPAPPIQNEGVLATIIFEVSGNGPFTIEVKEAKLVSAKLVAIPVTTTDLFIAEGQVANATPESPGVGSVYRGWIIVGLSGLALGLGLWLWLRSKWAGATVAGSRAGPRRMPGAAGSSTRTAALLTEQGNRAVQQGDLAQAYEHFSRAVELDPANAAAWLGKGFVAQQETEKRICFQRALALDPQNAAAQTALQQLNVQANG